MICPKCGDKMTLLFIHYACDSCDGIKGDQKADHVDSGYIVWHSKREGFSTYVFCTVDDCIKWRAASKFEDSPIMIVATMHRLSWIECVGAGAILTIADAVHKIYSSRDKIPADVNQGIVAWVAEESFEF